MSNSFSPTVRHMPAEWEPHRATWVAWPHDAEFWGKTFEAAKYELASLCRALAEGGDRLEMLVRDENGLADARRMLEDVEVRFHQVEFDDIWMRDIGPVFTLASAALTAVRFRFNGWGGKWEHERDSKVAKQVARIAEVPVFDVPLCLEGGALEFDGRGTCITTRSCVLNPNRNPGRTEREVEEWLGLAFGVRKTIWLERGFDCDHTDGHVDNLVRFVGPGRVICMAPDGALDPNADVLAEVRRALAAARDAAGQPLEVLALGSPGTITGEDGRLLAASYMNYCVTNDAVVVPTFGARSDAAAVDVIASCFPSRSTIGLPARSILSGGGSFHCITQQEPLPGMGEER